MQLAHRWLDRNLTRLELVVALVIIVFIMGTFIRHIQRVFMQAEMSMVDTTIINLNSSLKYHAAMAVLRGDYEQLSRMNKMNPVSEIQSLQNDYENIKENLELVARTATYPVFNQPINYIGELVNPELDTLQKGVWYFDPGEKTLNYHPNNSSSIFGRENFNKVIKFRVNIRYTDKNADGRNNPGNDRFLSISIDNVDNWED